jgi:hypothetical protein
MSENLGGIQCVVREAIRPRGGCPKLIGVQEHAENPRIVLFAGVVFWSFC